MNSKALEVRLLAISEELKARENQIALGAALQVLAAMKIRIFEEGRATNGTLIGAYSRKPIYVKEYPGARKIKPDSGRKTKKYDGWRGFRVDVGRQVAKVDLSISGALQTSLRAEIVGSGRAAIGFDSKKESEIMAGNEKHFKKIIGTPSKVEREKAAGFVKKTILRIL